MAFKIYLAYCGPDAPKVEKVHQFLEEVFSSDDEITFFFDKRKFNAGGRVRERLTKEVASSKLVIAFISENWRSSEFFLDEIREAFGRNIQIVPVILIHGKDREVILKNLKLEDLDTRIAQASKVFLPYVIADDGFSSFAKLIRTVKQKIEISRELDFRKLRTTTELVADICCQRSCSLDIFLVNGGSTIQKLFDNEHVQAFFQAKRSLTVRFLYVDIECKGFIKDSPPYMRHQESLDSIDSRLFGAIYESLIYQSYGIENRNTHVEDLRFCINETLLPTSKRWKFHLEVRKTSYLPLFRMINTDTFAYYTCFLPRKAGIRSFEYLSLRFGKKSKIGALMAEQFNYLWSSAEIANW